MGNKEPKHKVDDEEKSNCVPTRAARYQISGEIHKNGDQRAE